MNTTAKRLKEGMELRGLKQSDMVERTGISKGALSSYLSGRYVPKQNNIYLLAKALNVNEAWLMGADVPMEKEGRTKMAAFKDMLKYLRNREGLSQAELASKLGLGTSTISMYEVGKREPDFETLESIADFFNVDMNFLLGKNDSENKILLTKRDTRDIEKILDQTREQLTSQEGLMFEGEPATPEAFDSILAAMHQRTDQYPTGQKRTFQSQVLSNKTD